MTTEMRLPELPLGGRKAVVLRWLKRAGEPVVVGEPLLIVLTEQAELLLPAPSTGRLAELLATEGQPADPGAQLATILVETQQPSSAPSSPALPAHPARSPRTLASPLARRVAAGMGIDISGLQGSGVAGRVIKADVLARIAAARPGGAASPVAHTRAQAPRALTVVEVDLGPVVQAIEGARAAFRRRGLVLTILECIALAAVEALLEHPRLNSSWAGEYIAVRRRIDLALIRWGQAPALIRNAQDLNLRGIARAMCAPGLASAGDACFTIVQSEADEWAEVPSIGQESSAALAIGAVCRRPIVIAAGGEDRIAVRPAAFLSLSYDARVLDQQHADAFLRDLSRRLERFAA